MPEALILSILYEERMRDGYEDTEFDDELKDYIDELMSAWYEQELES